MAYLILLTFLLAGCRDAPERGATLPTAKRGTPEAQLAAEEIGSQNISAVVVDSYATELDALGRKCREPRDTIAEHVSRSITSVEGGERRDITLLAFLRMLNEAMQDGVPKVSCADQIEMMKIGASAKRRP